MFFTADFIKSHPELCNWRTRALSAVCGLAMFCAAAGVVFSIARLGNVEVASRVINDIQINPTILLPGQKFNVHLKITVNKLCPYEVQWSLINSETNTRALTIVDPIRNPGGKLGPVELDHERTIPAETQPGTYGYLTEVFDECEQPNVISSVVRARYLAPGITIR